jgi:non-ribosomal peptide synthetase component E (peptide arylation enzyme)
MLPERRTVGVLLEHLAQAIPQQEAVVFPPQRLTYAALHQEATAVARGLWGLGIRHMEIQVREHSAQPCHALLRAAMANSCCR